MLQMLMQSAGEALVISGTGWDGTFGYASGELKASAGVILGAMDLRAETDGALTFFSQAYNGKLARVAAIGSGTAFITVAPEMDLPLPALRSGFTATALSITPAQDWFAPLPAEPAPTLARAEVIIDIGYGVRDKAGMELAQELKQTLERMGLAPMFGATRKVTQDLKLLPLDAQIGQTGVRVNPKLILCLGISGAPQHIDYLGTRAEVLCFNKDPEAPLMQLSQTRSAPRVHPVAGDLFVTVRELIGRLQQ
jgi:electron transfer flavoprotein alpha subunit